MANIVLFDDITWGKCLPITLSRPVSELRIGILTISEKWQHYFPNHTLHCHTENYLSIKYTSYLNEAIWINSSFLPEPSLVQLIKNIQPKIAFYSKDNVLIAFVGTKNDYLLRIDDFEKRILDNNLLKINTVTDLFIKNEQALNLDFELLTKDRVSQLLDKSNTLLGKDIFIEKGAKIACSILNTSTGKIYIGKNAEIMEGSMIRGGLALCEGSTIKMGAKIYGATTIGPYSKVGGEISNSVILGYSNKGHDGYLGNSVLGEWCNLGADTNNSNLKNNYSEVKLWSYLTQKFEVTGLQFCGLIMGDHSKSAINTMFNTGTSIGFSSNIFGAGFPRNFIPSYSWGSENYDLKKAMAVAEKVMERRNIEFTNADASIFSHIFSHYGNKQTT